MFNTNMNQTFKCDNYIVALLKEIENQLSRVMWNRDQKEYDSPFDNTANTFKNNVFEVQAYSWDDEVCQSYNFKYKNIEISWYKYLGRDTTINGQYSHKEIIDMFDKCIESILEMDVKE